LAALFCSTWSCGEAAANTGGGTRTLNPFREADFESAAYANSATPALNSGGHDRRRQRNTQTIWRRTLKFGRMAVVTLSSRTLARP
jgi:hypothetical protein